MLQSIRDRTQGWIAGVIISLVILSFALWGIHSYVAGAGASDNVAKVNGVEITKRDFATAYERLRRQAQMNIATANLSTNIEGDLKRRALDALVNIQVLKQAAIAEDYRVSQRQVEGYLEGMPEFQVNGQFSPERFQQLLTTSLYTTNEFIDLIGTTLLIDQPRLGIIFTSFALPNEINNSVALVNQERDIQYMRLPLDYFLNQNIPVSDDEIQAYYKEHQNDFKTPEQVTIEYVDLSVKDLMANIHPTDEALKTYYNDNIGAYTLPQQWMLDKLLIPASAASTLTNGSDQDAEAQKKALDVEQKLSSGQDFSVVAHDYPTGDTTPPTWVSENQLPPELQKAVVGLTKVGQISDPIKTSKGLLIVKVSAIKEAQVQPFDQVKDKIQEAVTRQQAEEKFAELKEKLSSVSYEHPDSLEQVSKALDIPVKVSSAFSLGKEAGSDDISAYKKVRDAAFSDDVLNSQNNSDAIQLSADDSVVLRVKSRTPATLLSLDSVRQQITDTLKKKKADEKAELTAKDILKKLQTGATPDQVALEYNFPWEKVGYIGRYATKVDSAILFTAFRLPIPAEGKGASYGTVKIPNGYALVATNAVRNGKVDDKDQYEVFGEQTQNTNASLEYKLYVQSLMDKAKISSQLDQADK